MGSPTGDRTETATTVLRPSIVKHGVEGLRKKQKSHSRLTLPSVQPTTPGESIPS